MLVKLASQQAQAHAGGCATAVLLLCVVHRTIEATMCSIPHSGFYVVCLLQVSAAHHCNQDLISAMQSVYEQNYCARQLQSNNSASNTVPSFECHHVLATLWCEQLPKSCHPLHRATATMHHVRMPVWCVLGGSIGGGEGGGERGC